MTKTIMVTGGCGFIGHHFIEHLLKNTNWNIIIIDKLTYASKGFNRLKNAGIFNNEKINIYTYDLCIPFSEGLIKEFGDVNYIIHMAADTHVDNSIKNPVSVVNNNVTSTLNLLEYARTLKNLNLFFYFGTDEVFGPALNGIFFSEWDRHKPSNPYSASKSASENICISYENTYKLPIIIVNVMNAFGERQHVEKFIPKCIKYILDGKKIEIHCDKTGTIPGSRFYIHARNIAQAILFLINNGVVGEKYNIVGEREVNNLEMLHLIAKVIGKEPIYEMNNFIEDRPGHDERYALNGKKLLDMGFVLPIDFDKSLTKTIEWTLQNIEWLDI
jgi:dTDP-glucose 4,6-dehydratase